MHLVGGWGGTQAHHPAQLTRPTQLTQVGSRANDPLVLEFLQGGRASQVTAEAATPRKKNIVEGLDMADPERWDWDSLMRDKLGNRSKLESVFEELMARLIKLDKALVLVKERLDNSERDQEELHNLTMQLEQSISECQVRASSYAAASCRRTDHATHTRAHAHTPWQRGRAIITP
jgi:hypothetical protein